jgi:hypothetical protein
MAPFPIKSQTRDMSYCPGNRPKITVAGLSPGSARLSTSVVHSEDRIFHVTCGVHFEGNLTADALGIMACLYTYSNLPFSLSDMPGSTSVTIIS